jgi:hypothetical protein
MAVSISGNDYLVKKAQGYTFYNNTVLEGIIFEFAPCDVSSNFLVTPLVEYAALTNGFSDVSAVARISVPCTSLDKLFYFYSSDFSASYNFSDNSSNSMFADVQYGINKDFSFNLSYSDAYIQVGSMDGNGTQQISDDYVRHIGYSLFEVTNLVDLFQNESDLVNGVAAMDTLFNQKINNDISNIVVTTGHNVSFDGKRIYLDSSENSTQSDIGSRYVSSCKQLLDGFLSIGSTNRGGHFFTDLSGQYANSLDASGNSMFYIPFRPNDMLSLKLTYKYAGGSLALFNTSAINDRSYKIILQCY